jgi:hypothetical protein
VTNFQVVEYFKSFRYLAISLTVMFLLATYCQDSVAQVALKQVPLGDGWLRLMENGELNFNGQIEVRGKFLAGGSLDSSNPNYEEGFYFTNSSTEVDLKGTILDLHRENHLYFILHQNPTTEEVKLFVFDSKTMAQTIYAASLLTGYEMADENFARLEFAGLGATALFTILGYAISGESVGSDLCYIMSFAIGGTTCLLKLMNYADPSLRQARTSFESQIEAAMKGSSNLEISPDSRGFYKYEGESELHILLNHAQSPGNRRLIPLAEIGREVHRSQGRLCEIGFLNL